jgi:hypothetical protein
MYIIGFSGIVVTTSIMSAMIAQYGGTDNKAGNGEMDTKCGTPQQVANIV